MSSNDFFRKLTCGAKFTSKNRQPLKRKLESDSQPLANIAKINRIIKEETNDEYNDSDVVEMPLVTERKEEIKSETSSDDSDDERKPSSARHMQQPKSEVSNEISNKIKHQNQLRKLHNIRVKKTRVISKVPNLIETFEQLGHCFDISSQLLSNIMGCYNKPTPVQMQAIPALLESYSLHVCAPTGSGKTAAFLIPILHHLKEPMKCGFRALIICPTRELAKQTQRHALRLGDGLNIRTHVIETVDHPTKSDYSLSGNRHYDILVSTPNRICYLLSQTPPKIDLSNIQWVVIDETDKLFECSKNAFRDQLDSILNACNNPSKTLALFSATQTRETNVWVSKNVTNYIRFSIGNVNGAVELVEQQLLFTGSEGGKLLAFRDMVGQGLHPPVLVFVQSKDRAQQLFTELIYDGLNVDVIHSDRSQRERDNVVRAFREGKIWILICTELMSRGIDFKGVNLVINYDFPPSTISYVHRIGRTGRAGRPGKAITFFTKNDTVNLKSIAHLIKAAGGEVPEYMLKFHGSSKKSQDNLLRKAPKRATIRTMPSFEQQQIQRKKKFGNKSAGKHKAQNRKDNK